MDIGGNYEGEIIGYDGLRTGPNIARPYSC